MQCWTMFVLSGVHHSDISSLKVSGNTVVSECLFLKFYLQVCNWCMKKEQMLKKIAMLFIFNLYIVEEMFDRKIALFFRPKFWKIIASFMEVAARNIQL